MAFGTTVALAATAAFFGAVVQGFSGFGFAIFTLSFLCFWLKLRVAEQIVFVTAAASCSMLLLRLWRQVPWRRLPLIAIGLAIGGPVGVWLGPIIPESVGKRVLGLIVMGISAPRLFAASAPCRSADAKPGATEVVVGLSAGLLSGWVNMSGPPLVYWAHHRLEPTRARAILSACFACAAVVKITALTAGGLWIRECVIAGLVAVPAVLAGSWLGDVAARRSRPALYAKLIWGLFFLLGALLLVLPASGAKTTTNDRPSTMERPKSQAGMRSAPGPNPGGEAAWPDAKR